ncbi:MAG: imidazole glycerol phosphate synthase subunit HisH [Clostridia bacterium]|nr:imidazole glycerol phosphate synthase subunit HisH [Clostridia bacterium]
MIAIIDYGMGNLRSVQKAFEYIGQDAKITDRAVDLVDASHIVLPGVGAFKDAMTALNKSGIVDTLKKEIAKGKPFLGICLGMQMLFDKSYEDGEYEGLGLIKGEVVRFDTNLKVPHIGWNELQLKKRTRLFDGVDDMNFYFVHSYHASGCNQEDVETTCIYDYEFVSSVNKDNVWGAQFHPEKSGDTGLKLLANFAKIK